MATPKSSIEVGVKVDDPAGLLTDKRWYRSKKFAIWLISFLGFGAGLAWALQSGAEWKIATALVAGMTCVSMTGLLGQAFVDAAVRFARAWRGLGADNGGVWSEAEPE